MKTDEEILEMIYSLYAIDGEWNESSDQLALDLYHRGYDQGQAEIICMLADFLGVSLTFEDPVALAKKLMRKDINNG